MTKKERNYGVDAFRIVAMFFVVALHTLQHGGILEALPAGTLSGRLSAISS